MKINLIFILSFFVFNESPDNLENGIFDNNPFENVEVCLELFNKEKKHIKYEHDKHLVLPCEFGYKRIGKFLDCSIQLANEGNKEALNVAKKIYRDMADGMLYGEVNLNMELVYEIVKSTLKKLNNKEEVFEIGLWFLEPNICSNEMYESQGISISSEEEDSMYHNYSYQIYGKILLPIIDRKNAMDYSYRIKQTMINQYERGIVKNDLCSKERVKFIYPILLNDFREGKIVF